MVTFALAYAGIGWAVFPVWWIRDGACACGDPACISPGKHPLGKLVPNGLLDASTDSRIITAWWAACPLANIAVATGANSRCFAIDDDPRKGGDAVLKDYEAKHGKLPQTVTQITGGGGRHLLFAHPGRKVKTAIDVLGPGVDVRGDGGYIVVAPSLHVSGGRYEWQHACGRTQLAIAVAPDWLLSVVAPLSPAKAPSQPFRFDPTRQQEVALARQALSALARGRCDSYDYWLRVGMCLHAIDAGPAMLAIWEEWSRGSPKFREGECAKKWATFRQDGDADLRTLLRMAHEDTGGKFRPTSSPAASIGRVPRSRRALPPFVPFPVNVLPEPLRSFVESVSRALGCDPSFVAQPVLAAVTAVIGNTRRIQLKPGWCEVCVVWTAFVGSPGTLKSPALDKAMGPLRRLAREELNRFKEEQRLYEIEKKRYEAELADWKRSKDKNTTDPPEPPEEPLPQRYIVSDTTVEALVLILEGSPRGVLLVRDELAAWLRGFDQYKGGHGSDCQAFLEFHRAGSVTKDRVSGGRTIQIERAAVSITGGIQPGTLRRTLRAEFFETGLAARLLLAWPPRRPKRWTDCIIDASISERYDALFDGLVALAFGTAADGSPEPINLPLTPEGQKAFIRFYDDLAAQQADADDEVAGALAKIEGYAARFALVFHLVREEANDPALDDGNAIDQDSVNAGVTLARWFAYEARRIYSMLHETEEEGEQRRLIELIQRRGGRIRTSQLQKATSRYRHSAKEAKSALDGLVEAGHGRWDPIPIGRKGGRPTEEFVLTEEVASPSGNPDDDVDPLDGASATDSGIEEAST